MARRRAQADRRSPRTAVRGDRAGTGAAQAGERGATPAACLPSRPRPEGQRQCRTSRTLTAPVPRGGGASPIPPWQQLFAAAHSVLHRVGAGLFLILPGVKPVFDRSGCGDGLGQGNGALAQGPRHTAGRASVRLAGRHRVHVELARDDDVRAAAVQAGRRDRAVSPVGPVKVAAVHSDAIRAVEPGHQSDRAGAV